MPQPVWVVTGASGLVGGELLRYWLASRPTCELVALGRRRPELPGVTAIEGDIRLPFFGLDPERYSALAASLTGILHCAAETRFGLPIDEIRTTNVAGTRHLLDLARRAPKLDRFAFVSTAYVAGRMSGRIPEEPLDHGCGFSNTYQQSKHEAETLVVGAMRELPAAIYRLSSIIGDSRTGLVRQFNYTHQLLRLFPRNVLPLAPVVPDMPVDLIAADWVVSAISHLFTPAFTPGVFHLCAGAEASLTAGEMIERTIAEFESHPAGRRFLPIHVPRFVSLAEYEEYVASAQQGDDRLLKDLLRVLGYFLPHLGIYQAFENGVAMSKLEASGMRLPPVREYFPKMVRYCLETNWGRDVTLEASPRGRSS